MKKAIFVLCTILFVLCGLFQMTFTVKAEENEEYKMIIEKLAEPFSCSDIENPVTIIKAASYISKKTEIPIVIDHAELKEAGITVDDHVQFDLPFQVSLKDALDYLVKQKRIGWVVNSGLLILTTKEKAKGDLFTRTYYVGDLLETVYVDLPVTDEKENKNLLAAVMGHRKLENNTFKSLMDYITTMVAPESWKEGTGGGMLEYYPNLSLVVRQTEDVHQQISILIANLRKINSKTQFSFLYEVIPAKETVFTENNRIMHGNCKVFCCREFDFTVFKEHRLENCLIRIAPRSLKPVANDLTSKNEPFVFPFQAGKTVKVKGIACQQDGNDVIKMTLCVEGKEPETRTFYASPIIEEEREYLTRVK